MKQSRTLQSELKDFELELSQFNSRDLLAQFNMENALAFEGEIMPLTREIEKMIQEAQRKDREEGFFSSCLSEGMVSIKNVDPPQQVPLYLHMISPLINPVLKTVQWNVNEEEWLVNPYLVQMLSFESIDFENPSKEYILQKLSASGYEIDSKIRFLGNFHPFRYALLKEVSSMRKQDIPTSIELIFNGSSLKDSSQEHPIPSLLFPCDQAQLEAINRAKTQSIVIQGPPGTGKSQVIANLIGNKLKEGQRILVASHKKQALEVIETRLKEGGIGDLVIRRDSNEGTKSLLSSLAKSWQKMEEFDTKEVSFSFLPQLNTLQTSLKIYHQKGIIGALSPKEFLKETGLDPRKIRTFKPGLPGYEIWKENEEFIAAIPWEKLQLFGWVSSDLDLSLNYESLLSDWAKLINDIRILPLAETTLETLENHQQKAQLVFSFNSEIARQCLPWVLKKKKILKMESVFNHSALKLEGLMEEMRAWRHIPTALELTALKNQWSGRGIMQKLKSKSSKKTWLRNPEIDIQNLLVITQEYHLIQKQKQLIEETLASEGIMNPKSFFGNFQSFLTLYDSKKYQEFEGIPISEREFYIENYMGLLSVHQRIRQQFNFSKSQCVITQIQRVSSEIEHSLQYLKIWQKINPSIKGVLKEYSSASLLKEDIISTDWHRFISKYPELEDIATLPFSESISTLNKKFLEMSENFASEILRLRIKKFFEYEHILATSNHKLNQDQIQFKKKLQSGKRTLIKLFARKRNFPKLQELLLGDAQPWIEVLKPIWLSSPVKLAMDFVLAPKIFDLAIIDEASQLPLSHAMGTLFRAEQVVIAGDQMQMPPSFQFQKGSKDKLSLLDQAAYNLPNCKLNFHYRSKHPALIRYSNINFYGGDLLAFPSYPTYNAIEDYKLEGIYNQGINEHEAMFTKDLLIKLLNEGVKKLGLVAFSERQLKQIINSCHPKEWERIQRAVYEDRLFLKSIEQVQGDECDEIIISFGYGKNPDGQFEKRFGPINLEGGEKRLNVLFSRAKKKIHFVRSVEAKDFGYTDNPAVSYLKKWFDWLESEQKLDSSIYFKGQRFPVRENRILMPKMIDLSASLLDLLSFNSVLQERGWVIDELDFSLEQGHTRVLPLDDSVKSA